jgi:hypothetical protein
VLTGRKAKLLSQVWRHYLLQQQVVSNVIGFTGKIRSASESEIAVGATGVYHTESGSRGSGFYSTVWIRDLVEEPAGATGEHATVVNPAKQEPLQARRRSTSCPSPVISVVYCSAPDFQHTLDHSPILLAALHDIDYVERTFEDTLHTQVIRAVPSVRASLVVSFQPIEEILPYIPPSTFCEDDTILPDACVMYPVRHWCRVC